MGRPKSKEVEAVEKIIEDMHKAGTLTAQTKPRHLGLSPAVAKKMHNRISPILTAAKERLAKWRRQREETYRQSRNQQHALEQLDREAAALVAAREKAYQAAKAAWEARKKSE